MKNFTLLRTRRFFSGFICCMRSIFHVCKEFYGDYTFFAFVSQHIFPSSSANPIWITVGFIGAEYLYSALHARSFGSQDLYDAVPYEAENPTSQATVSEETELSR